MDRMRYNRRKDASSGFTLVELMIVIALMGILASIAVPMMKNYVIRAKFATVNSVLRQLMNGQDLYFLENGEFYPGGSSGKLSIEPGQSIDIPELGYKFPLGHSNRIIIQTVNSTTKKKKKKESKKINRYDITIDTDFDANGNGLNDRYMVTTDFRNESPLIKKGIEYDRYLRQLW